ncbi:hypothetical protein HHI36_019600 [Cryptolaemus montrouzieri]|uniref:Chaoptin n=1 Tax=Cryptolaemus montrouzieri TaxID=559131 RepID=A0ABD2N7Y0_9CUCU
MKTLHLENISISVIPKNSLLSDSLETFEFISNGLVNIDDVPLCGIPNIRVINFKKNRIKHLKPDLYQCSTPKKWGHSKNSLFENNHLSIESIDLSHNEISILTKAFNAFTKLSHLNLQNNSIQHISDIDFENNFALEHLNLADNSISVISKAAFTKLHHLRDINLSHNKIIQVELKLLPQLSDINLSYNKITFEKIQGIHHLLSLETLDLSYNELNGTSNFLIIFLQQLRLTSMGIISF